jgi:hypothetical protein
VKRQKTYGFSVILTTPALSIEECDALYEAGCDDGTIVTRNKVTFIAFDRKADSLEQAIRSATANVRAAGLEVERVEMPALVSPPTREDGDDSVENRKPVLPYSVYSVRSYNLELGVAVRVAAPW